MDTQNKKLKLSGVEFFKTVSEPTTAKTILMKNNTLI